MGTIRKKALERYELGDSVEVLDQVQPVLIVNPSNGAIDSGNEVTVNQAAKDRTVSGTATVTQVAKDRTVTGTATVTQAAKDRKRGSGSVDNANVTGDGTAVDADCDLGSAKEVTDIFISAHDSSGAPTPVDVPVLIIAGQAASPTDQLVEYTPDMNGAPNHFKVDIHARIIRAEFVGSTTGTVYELGVSYWDL